VLDDQAIEHRLCDALFLRRPGGDRLEEQSQPLALRSVLVGLEDQFIQRDVQGQQRNGDQVLFSTVKFLASN